MIKMKPIYFAGFVLSSLLLVSPAMAKSTLSYGKIPLALNSSSIEETALPNKPVSPHSNYLRWLLGKTIYLALLESDTFLTLEGWINTLSEQKPK